ncbi:hypothetical protein TPHA_0M00880 [Tetrapisispora phaffii CBS 4417]|uniref:Aminomethyltransferase n=1 Tax=Tetrapisispora phaffii (strain ATCC 24235 / CBS 4417 / NBRC 1672 / NRRL Y-8282 / UCD 70-5) TaxID=1071381 RepID=G8C0E8_TETPH|nr:hypothetical protein TPHA_0M00880 [Tetrapisispora phaffii CBS 4417]CCE65663.1 hypothetical protein TPHA_0M00880 [Tetrapisispora phaffii CBS 4417]
MSSFICKRFSSTSSQGLKKTALFDLHIELGATMVPFAGYSMPLLYKGQTHVESHKWTRTNAGVFDVSHMLQSSLQGEGSLKFLERITPTDFSLIKDHNASLSVFLNENGGIVDDTMITKVGADDFYIVNNAGCADRVKSFIPEQLSKSGYECEWKMIPDRSLLALQGPMSSKILQNILAPSQTLNSLSFGQRRLFKLFNGVEIQVARSGYTGEDGFEISMLDKDAVDFAKLILDNELTKPIGLAARDSLRLEAGLCLYGNELTESITPVEAALNWIISRSRRNLTDPNAIKFNGYEKIIDQLKNKSSKELRAAFKYTGRGPAARKGAKVYLPDKQTLIGTVTSGSASPSLNNINIGQVYVKNGYHKAGTELVVEIRGKFYPITIEKSPLVPTHYYRTS